MTAPRCKPPAVIIILEPHKPPRVHAIVEDDSQEAALVELLWRAWRMLRAGAGRGRS